MLLNTQLTARKYAHFARVRSSEKYSKNTEIIRTSEYRHVWLRRMATVFPHAQTNQSAARPAGDVGRGRVSARARIWLRERGRLYGRANT